MSQPLSRFNHRMRMIAPLVIFAVGIGTAIIIVRFSSVSKPNRPNPTAPMVTTVAPVKSEGVLVFHVDGVVVPYREILLSAEVSGKVTMKADEEGEPLQEGSYVTAGTELLQIDSRKYDLEVQRLEAERKQAGFVLKEIDHEFESMPQLLANAELNLKIQTDQYNRFAQLAASNAITTSQLEKEHQVLLTVENQKKTLSTQEKTLESKKSSLEQAIKLVETKLEQAIIDLANTKITSPINGVIIKDYVEKDSYVQVGASLYEIEDTKAVEVRCNLRMNELAWIWKSRTKSTDPVVNSINGYGLAKSDVTVVYQLAGHEYTWDGHLSRFDGIGLDEKTRTAPVLVRVPKPTEVKRDGTALVSDGPSALLRGMYVQLKIEVKTETPIWKIPERALQPGNFVWLAEGGKLARKNVHVIHRQEIEILIDGELTQKSEVLIDGSITPLSSTERIIISPLPVSIVGLPVLDASAVKKPMAASPSDINSLPVSTEGK
ncbi:MAG: hypothetical protein COA78_10755 [Blastopirellula sp.]|nr:MAG: hypothetical protein COA78_10755 [Blastopirellula sp.]